MKFLKESLSLLLSCCLVFATMPGVLVAQADQSAVQPPVQAAQQTPEQLQRRSHCIRMRWWRRSSQPRLLPTKL